MQKTLSFIALLAFAFSCNNDKNLPNEIPEPNQIIESSYIYPDNTLRMDNISVDLDFVKRYQTKLLSSYKDDEGFSGAVKIASTALIKRDGVYQLRTQFDNGYETSTFISTVSGKNARVGAITLFGISCKSKACANNSGCSALEDRCSACSGDCEKTSTSESE